MSTRLASCSVLLGLTAGAGVAITETSWAPPSGMTLVSVFTHAVFLLGLVFLAAFLTTYAAFLISGVAPKRLCRQFSVNVGMTVLWLLPLLIFAEQQSWLVVILWAIFLFHLARFAAFLMGQVNADTPPAPGIAEDLAFSVLKRDFPFAGSIVGVLLVQSAVFEAVSGHDVLSGQLYFLGTAAIAHRTFLMFRNDPDRGDNTRDKIAPILGTVVLLTVFAWLPYTYSGNSGGAGSANRGADGPFATGGDSNSQATNQHANRRRVDPTTFAWLRSIFTLHKPGLPGDSFSAAKRIFEARFPAGTERPETGSKSQSKTGMLAALPVIGPVFPAVELYPAEARKTKLIAPPLQRSSGFGPAHSDLVSIPFDGVYRFWKGPSEVPPPNVVVMHGSPSARSFRSTDHEIMSMEARESLGFAVNPRLYGAIEIVLENVDPFPNSVSIALRVHDTANPGKWFRALGLARVSSAGADGHPKMQTLSFTIPATISSFDELVVTYYLQGERSDRSARIAIQGFRLVPRVG